MVALLTPQQRRELAARAIVPEKTVKRAYQHPERSRNATLARLTKAAGELGLPPPPPAGGRAA